MTRNFEKSTDILTPISTFELLIVIIINDDSNKVEISKNVMPSESHKNVY